MAPEMQTTIRVGVPTAPRAPRVVPSYEVERLRLPGEAGVFGQLRQHPYFRSFAAVVEPELRDPRQTLLAKGLRISEASSPDAYRVARGVQRVLDISEPVELYRNTGREDLSVHLHASPVLLELQPRFLALLDPPALQALFGHEYGHYIAHGPDSAIGNAVAVAARLEQGAEMPAELGRAVQMLGLLRELTADRFALMACQDLHAFLRLEMASTTGLAGDALSWDTSAYVGQCRALAEAAVERRIPAGSAQAIQGMRAYAAELFFQSKYYRELTGAGPGRLELDFVNEQVQNVLATTGAELDYHHIFDAPPQELHECALAGTVLVAYADGVLSEDEAEAIENIFAPLVGDWRSYLDHSTALQRFHESAPVVAASGVDLHRSLFQLLVHVMGADGIVDPDEVGAIKAIGQSLGCADEFQELLAPTLRALGVSVELADSPTLALPLPARTADVAHALDAFVRGLGRRGETSITLRRLLKLTGTTRRTEANVSLLLRTFQSSGISLDVDLTVCPLDELLTLQAPNVLYDGDLEEVETDTSRSSLVRGLTRLRDKLVVGDGRSPSVRLRRLRPGRVFDLLTLNRVAVGRAERVLEQVQAIRVARLVDAEEAGRHATAAKCSEELVKLHRSHADRVEETGAHDLCVGYPLLSGNVGRGAEANQAYLVRAPLLLIPVDLARDGQGARGFKLQPRRDEPPVVNQSLLRLICNKRNFGFPEKLSEELDALASEGATAVPTLVAKLVKVGIPLFRAASELVSFRDRSAELEARDFSLEIEECALLGLFPQSNSDLLQDYDGLLSDLTQAHASPETLLGAASVLLPQAVVGSTAGKASARKPAPPVVHADPSQRAAVEICRQQTATVIDGPPGTGKSQVIVNLVADALGRGERVAVVCEKRAALDVVGQRLESLGLRHAVAVVHDVQEDRKKLYQQIYRRLDEYAPQRFDASEARRLKAAHTRVAKRLETRRQALAKVPAGLELTVGELHVLDSAGEGPVLDTGKQLESLTQAQLGTLTSLIGALHPLQEIWTTGSFWDRPRATLVGLDQATHDAIRGALAAALASAETLAGLQARSTADLAAVRSARTALLSLRDARELRRNKEADAVFKRTFATAARNSKLIALTSDAGNAWNEHAKSMLSAETQVVIDAPETEAALELVRVWSGRWSRFVRLAWWRARGAVKRGIAEVMPDKVGHPLDARLLLGLHTRFEASRGWRRIMALLHEMQMGDLAPKTAAQLATLVGLLAEFAPASARLLQSRPLLEAASCWCASATDWSNWDRTTDERLELLDRADELEQAAKELTGIFGWLEVLPKPHALQDTLERFDADAWNVHESDRLIEQVSELVREPLRLLGALRDHARESSAEEWIRICRRAWAHEWLAKLAASQPVHAAAGSQVDDEEHGVQAVKHGDLDQELAELAIEHVLSQLDDAHLLKIPKAEKRKRRTPDQATKELVAKETKKQRRLMPLRSFVRKFTPAGLLDLLPTWLMSPDTMAVLFPRQPVFDLVIFDEASQCTVESGFPVLLRAKRVVIAGDEKQMPPSSFFALGGSDDELDEAEDSESDRDVRDALSAESLLTLARSRVRHVGLGWHYRCIDESLIAFSNHAMYHGQLLTIPSTAGTAAPSALRWIHVEDGRYEAGVNLPEAERVVDLVYSLLADEQPPSIGIATFNIKQRSAIRDAIERRSEEDAAFGALWAAANRSPDLDLHPFIKNLEQVQGDERDVIIFSLGHSPKARRRAGAKTGELYVPARFGPLGRVGGERRLNVAISRAKRACYVVSSFEPSMLSVANAKNEGPKLFKQFLEYAWHLSHGRQTRASRVLDLVREARVSPHHRPRRLPFPEFIPLNTQIALALEKHGVPYELDVGASEFRVPLAVYTPDDPSKFALAIFPEDGTEDASAFEKYVHRPAVLQLRGWQVLRVSAASWRQRRQEVISQIFSLVPGAKGAATSPAWLAHLEQQRAEERRVAPKPPPIPLAIEETEVVETAESAPEPAKELPTWAMGIDDAKFRRALIHLDAHGALGEVELVNLVGGPRRARKFARQLDGWLERLPFRLEVQTVGSSKVYRSLGPK